MTSGTGDTAGKAPDWASMFAAEEWAWFITTLATDLDRRGITHRFDIDTGCVHCDVSGSVPNVLGLQNLAQICRGRPRDAWAEAVRHHFDVALDVKDGRAAEELAKDWSLAREKVKLRLYREESLPDVPLVTWHVAEGLVAVLTFDLPDTVISVRASDRETWAVDDEELYETALDNVRNEGLLDANRDRGRGRYERGRPRGRPHVLRRVPRAVSRGLPHEREPRGHRGLPGRVRRGHRHPTAARRHLPPDRRSPRRRSDPEHARHRREHVRGGAGLDQPRSLLAATERPRHRGPARAPALRAYGRRAPLPASPEFLALLESLGPAPERH